VSRALRIVGLVVVAIVAANGWWASERQGRVEPPDSTAVTTPTPDAQDLPREARETLAAIARGGPFPYDRDGTVFQNREGRLPTRPRGYYREYTVATPGSPDRGARRIVTGGNPPEAYYYTDDHYRSFRRIEDPPR
jgi:guanyl-specific ribonuclease Sa